MERSNTEKIAELLERPGDEKCQRELASLMVEHPEVVASYVEQWRVHSLLEWSLSPAPDITREKQFVETNATTLIRHALRTLTLRTAALWVVAATIAIISLSALYFAGNAPLGQIVEVHDIAWAHGAGRFVVGEPFRRGVLQANAGSCTLRFDSGVELICDGAFRLEVVNEMLVKLDYGKLRATVPEGARGFSVDTPDTFLVDQGTEFGVAAGNGTKVVVFRGEVDVRTKHLHRGGATRRLTQGEAALLLSGNSVLDRVSQITTGGLPTSWSTNGTSVELLSIRDNIRSADSLKYYNIVVGGLHEDVPAWVDRVHQWNGVTPDGIPAIIRGADYVQTFNDDRYNRSFKMFVTIRQPAILYVMIDNRVSKLPTWLVRDFQDTGEVIGLDEGVFQNYRRETAVGSGQSIDQTFSIWRQVVPTPCELELGGIDAPAEYGMYGLAVMPLKATPAEKRGQ